MTARIALASVTVTAALTGICQVWSAYQLFRLRSGDLAGAKELLTRSMQSLARHKHVEVILKFAQVWRRGTAACAMGSDCLTTVCLSVCLPVCLSV